MRMYYHYKGISNNMEDFNYQKTNQLSIINYILWNLVGIGLGSLIGAIAGSFMYAQHYLIKFLWETVPDHLGGLNPLHTFITCVVGGLIVGVVRKHLGDEPQSIHAVLRSIKTGENVPGIKTVPAAFLLSLISLGFGAALGPEAALIGIAVGFSSWTGETIARYAKKLNLADLQKPWSKIPGYLAMVSGFTMFALVARPMFSLTYSYFPYQYSLAGDEIFISIVLGFMGLLVGKTFSLISNHLDKLLIPIKNKPILTSLLGGVLLGGLGMLSPLILFSGQIGFSFLFENGLEMSGLFLIMIGVLKMISTKTNSATGWKGGEFFPVMFASAVIGLGISNLIPGINPMVAIAALMAATVTIVMDNIYIALAVVLLFLPVNLIIPMLVASLVAMVTTKNFIFSPKFAIQKVSVKPEKE